MPRTAHAPARTPGRGFTLTELIVAIVVVGLLAALAVPALRAVQTRAHDEVAVVELAGIHREAAALAALSDGGAITAQVLVDASASASASGEVAPLARPTLQGIAGDGTIDPAAAAQPSLAYGHVSWAVTDGQLELAMVSRANHCAMLAGTATATARADIVPDAELPDEDGNGVGECVATAASGALPQPTGDGPTDEPTEDAPPTEELDPGTISDGSSPKDTDGFVVPDEHHADLEPDLDAGDPVAAADGPVAFAGLTSHLSNHPSAPHRLLLTDPAGGRVIQVRQNSNAAPADVTVTEVAAGLANPTAIVPGPSPAVPAGAGQLVLFDLYVTTDSGLVAIDPVTRDTRLVSSHAGGDALAGYACYDPGDATKHAGTCLYAGQGNIVTRVTVDGGTATTYATLPAGEDIAGLAFTDAGLAAATADGDLYQVPLDQTDAIDASHATAGAGGGGLAWVGTPSTAGNQGLWAATGDAVAQPGEAGVALGGAALAHYHGNTDTVYATDADGCLHRVTLGSGPAQPMWCGGEQALGTGPYQATTVADLGTPFSSTTSGWLNGEARSLDVDGTTLFYGGSEDLGSYDLDTGTKQVLASHSQDELRSVAVAPDGTVVYAGGSYIYNSTYKKSYIRRWDGTSVTTLLSRSSSSYGGGEQLRAVAVADDGTVYFTSTAGVQSMALDGSNVTTVATLDVLGHGIAVDDTHVWVTDVRGELWRVPRSGGTPEKMADNLATVHVADSYGSADELRYSYNDPRPLEVTGTHVITARGTRLVAWDRGTGEVTYPAGNASASNRDGAGMAAFLPVVFDLAVGDDGTVGYASGERVVSLTSSRRELRGNEALTATTITTTIAAATKVADTPAWAVDVSDDGKRVYFGAADLQVYDVDSGQTSLVWSSPIYPSGEMRSVASAGGVLAVADGSSIYNTSSGKGYLRLLDPDSGAVSTVRGVGTGYYYGDRIASTTVTPDGSVFYSYLGEVHHTGLAGDTVVATLPEKVMGLAADATHLYALTADATIHRMRHDGSALTAWTTGLGTVNGPNENFEGRRPIAVDDAYLYTTNTAGTAVVRIDKATGTRTFLAGVTGAGDRDGAGHLAWLGDIRELAVGNGVLWVASNQGLYRLAPSTAASTPAPHKQVAPVTTAGTATAVVTATGLRAVTVGGDGTVYVGHGDVVSRVDGSTLVELVPSVAYQHHVRDLAVHDGLLLATHGYQSYNSSGKRSHVTLVDPADGARTNLLNGYKSGYYGGDTVRGGVVLDDGTVIAARDTELLVAPHRAGAFTVLADLGVPVSGLDHDGTHAYARAGTSLWRITTDGTVTEVAAGLEATATFREGHDAPRPLAVSGGYAWTTSAAGTVVAVDLADGDTAPVVSGLSRVYGLAVSADALWVTDHGSGTLYRVQP